MGQCLRDFLRNLTCYDKHADTDQLQYHYSTDKLSTLSNRKRIFGEENMSSYTLGLDIGSKSIGWALVDYGNTPSIIGIGVRVYPEGVDRDTKGLEKSKNAGRREARGARRVHQRRRSRKKQLVRTLRTARLLPDSETVLLKLLQETDPYHLRSKGLDERLETYELGRVLYHLNQRRGFKSNRKSSKRKEEGQIAKAAGELQRQIEQSGTRTLGEYFARILSDGRRIRDHYTFRSMYEKEFDLLWAKQKKFHPEILSDELKKKIRDETIFFQRPIRWDTSTIGNCELEKDENGHPLSRCPRGDWYARRFRLLQDVNNLRICNSDGSVDCLEPEQREVLLDELSRKKEVKFTSIRKKLGLLETQQFNAEFEINDKGKKNDKLTGDVFNASMRNKKIFGAKMWDAMEKAEKIQLNEWIVTMEDDELREKLVSEYDLDEEQIKNVMNISLPQRYMSFSQKAIIQLLPLVEQGMRTDEALAQVYPDRNKDDIADEMDRLPLPSDLLNPIVNRALFEVRKVVNAIVREYGKPGKIKIEMARDVRGGPRERRDIHFKMIDNKKRNEQIHTRLVNDINISKPSRDDIIKYKLWEECGQVCPYTGKHISQSALFGPNPEFQIEHILPYSRSLDDSFMNKTLCCVNENRLKGNQAPYEYYGSDIEKFEQLKQRVNRTAMPYWKKRRFWQKEIDTDEIISRELNYTRYICREVIKYLKHICKDVSGTRGKITHELAYQWGFVKDRNDHRHHAIDAAVVAVTKPKHLRELGQSKYSVEGIKFAQPWPHFREELAEKAKHINVSHRATRKVSGALHEETAYGPTKQKGNQGQDIYVYRKPLEALTKPMIAKIVDPVVRDIVRQRLISFDVDPDGRGSIPKDVWKKPLYMLSKDGKGPKIKKVRIHDVFNNLVHIMDTHGNQYRGVKPGNNHHIVIFDFVDKKGKSKRGGEVVSLFEAVSRARAGAPIVRQRRDENEEFVCSLCKGDMFILEREPENAILCRVQEIWESTNIVFRPHNNAVEEGDINKSASRLRGHKVTVDPLGRIWTAND